MRNAWPPLLQTAPFIKHMMCDVDDSERVSDMRARVGMQLIENLKGGPFFGGLSEPSLVDFAIFPQMVFNYMVGVDEDLKIALVPEVKSWVERITQYLPENPVLVPDFMIVNPIVDFSDGPTARKEHTA